MTTQAIFLSYASQDADAARRICDALRVAGLEVWFDQSELRGGDAWDASIRKQIKECALFVPVISANTQAREEGYFRLEWKLAVDRSHLMADNKAFFVPVLLGDISEPAALVPDKFRERQWSRLNDGDAIEKFTARIAKLLAGSGSQAINVPNAAPVLVFPSAPVNTPSHAADEGFWVAVLPFKHRGSNPDLAALAEGMSEEIVTGLSRFSSLMVIARGPTLQYTGEGVDVRAVGKALGARYVMEGNLRQAGATLRVSAQLVDANTGANLWAETYDRAFKSEDIFALQDDLVPRIVSTVADPYGVLPRSMNAAIRHRPIDQLTAYEAMIRSAECYERFTPESHALVRDCLEFAVKKAPGDSMCWAALSVVYLNEHAYGSNPRPDPLGRALDAARRGVDLAPTNHYAHQSLAQVFFFRKDFVGARHAAERSLKLNPMDAANLAESGRFLALTGDWERGCAMIEQAMGQNPTLPSWFWMASAFNAYRKQEYRAALEGAVKTNVPLFINLRLLIAASYGQLGDREAGGKVLLKLHADQPGFIALANEWLEKWFDAEMIAHLFEGLKKVGLKLSAESVPLSNPAGAVSAPSAVPAASDASIAVLAFANRSASADDEYFSDGLADELLTVLAKVRGLRVAARTSSFQFKGRNEDIGEIGRKLNVAHVLEGSVRKSGNRARISVQLVKVADGYQLWSETYDRTLDDIFAVQDDIAQSVVNELRAALLGNVHAQPAGANEIVAPVTTTAATLGRTQNSDAHRLRLQGRSLFQRPGHQDRLAAIPLFERAVELDPNYAGAWADLSFAVYWRSASGGAAGEKALGPHDYMKDFTMAKASAERATALEPNLPEALHARAAIVRIFDWNQRDAVQWLRQAVALAPNDNQILRGAATVIGDNGHLDEAITIARRAIELDPISMQSYAGAASLESDIGNIAAAESLYRIACTMTTPDSFFPRFGLFLAILSQRRFAECEVMLPEWSLELHRLLPAAMLAWAQGDHATSDARLNEVKELFPALACYQIAQIHAYRGEADATFDWLEKCTEVRDPGVFNAKTDRLFDFVHGDPRWLPTMRKLGFEV